MRTRKLYFVGKEMWISIVKHLIILSLFFTVPAFGQQVLRSRSFDSLFNEILAYIEVDHSQADKLLKSLQSRKSGFSPVEKAKTEYLRLKIEYSDKNKVLLLERRLFRVPDSCRGNDSLLYLSRKYLERSMPDKAITLLLTLIGELPGNSDKANVAIISLCEAYRQKQEYVKAISMLNELLDKPHSLSDKDRAYAYNRMAALYNEWGNPEINYTDSVFKYSNLCYSLAEKTASLSDLAASQNELSYQYIRKKEFDKALELALKSVENFKRIGMTFKAMNSLINLSNVYIGRNEFRLALQTLEEAWEMSVIEENRNLYMRIYHQFVRVYELSGKYRDAFEFLKLAHQLQIEFFKDRIDMQINEQSAKYDLLIKEQSIREEKEKNDYKQKQIVLLAILAAFLCLALLLSVIYFRMKRQGVLKQKLIEAVVETEANERTRIARDLHDGLGPVLSAISHYFQAYLDSKPHEKENIQIKLQQIISDAIEEVSRISHNISPYVLEKHGLITALNNFISTLKFNGRVEVNFISEYNERFDEKKELTVYRCITELLNNTLKHGEATSISLEIKNNKKTLIVKYSDNGKGFDINLNKSRGMGLYNLNNRVESMGGRLVIDSTPDKGSTTRIEFPI
ncbi:MAG: ATP-binding protein [Bacteroidales bacterium]